MKERPILFSGDEVRATLDGRKSQFRRPVKPQPGPLGIHPRMRVQMTENPPLGTVGDRLWVRETWGGLKLKGGWSLVSYKASGDIAKDNKWTPSIHMPRWASRITLEITAVRVERVQDITEEDAKAEGVIPVDYEGYEHPDNPTLSCAAHRYSFRDLWQSIYGTWDANPWVWVYEFRRIKP